MVGRGIAGGCALAAAALAAFAATSHVVALAFPLVAADHDVLLLHFYDGRTRLFWYRSPDEPIRMEPSDSRAWIRIRSQAVESTQLPFGEVGPPSPPVFNIPIRIGDRRQLPPLGGRWRGEITPIIPPPRQFDRQPWRVESSFVRLPTWPLVLVLMIPPIRRSIVERRRAGRQRRNECLECGYNLTALVMPRCPECGTAIHMGLSA